MGKIIFTTNDMLFSRLIKKFTKSKVSHAAFEYSSNIISHSTFLDGVNNWTKDAFKHSQTIVAVYEIPDVDYSNAKKIYRNKRTAKYGYFDIIYLTIAILLRRIIQFKNPIQDGLICSEYVSLYMDACLGTKLNSSSYPPTPEDLLEWCEVNLPKTQY